MAIQLLDECHYRNEIFTRRLVRKELRNWRDQSCVSIATGSKHTDFIAHTSCQDMLSQQWNGDLKIPHHSWQGIVREAQLLVLSTSNQ